MKYEENVIAFLRRDPETGESLLAVCNFSDKAQEAYRVGVPFYGKYKEIFNSDDEKYGGAGVKNPRVKTSKKEEWDERENSITFELPAFGAVIFSCTPEEEKKGKKPRTGAVK